MRILCRTLAFRFNLILSGITKTSCNMSKGEQWFYAVRNGKTPGIYFKWSDCELQVKGFTGASYKKFADVTEAAEFAIGKGTAPKRGRSPSPEKKEKVDNEDVSTEPKKKKPFENSGSFTGSSFEDEKGVSVYTDGGCFFNGKAGAQAGIGVYWGKDDPDNVSDKLPGRPTNNRAEIHAAVRAVQVAKKRGIENLILHTDSQFLINGITKWINGWKKRGWKLSTGGPVINKEDFEELDEAIKDMNVKWVYVKGHSGDPSNEAVDALAKSGAKKADPQTD